LKQVYKFVLLASVIFSCSLMMNAQAPMKWGWAKSIGGTGSESPAGIAADSRNGVYLLTNFSGSITTGSHALTSNGGTDICLVKYDTSGNIVWVKTFGGNAADEAASITTDKSSNLIINGTFEGSITFGSTVLTSSGASDVFTVKLRPDGTVVWAKQFTGSLADNAGPLECDHLLNIYMAGSYSSNNFTIDGASFTAASGYSNIYYCKLDSNGNRIWAKANSSSYSYSLYSLDVLPSGNLFMHGSMVAGGFLGVNFNPNIYNGMITLYSSIFTVKLRQDAGYMFQASVPDNRDFAGGTALTASKKIIKAGRRNFSSNGNAFAQLYLLDSNYSSSRNKAVDNLNFNNSTSNLNDVTATRAGRIYAAGYSYGNNSFGGIALNTPNFACLLWELDDTLGTRSILSISGQTNTSQSLSKVATDTTTGHVYAAGYFQATGTLTVGSNVLPAYGQNDVFVAQVIPGKMLIVNAGADTTICAGATVSIGGSAAGGVSPYTFSWSPAAGLSAPNAATTAASPAATTTYILTVTDSLGRTAKDTVVVNVNPAPAAPTVSASGPVTFCQGGSVTLTSSAGSSYTWSNGAATQSIAVSNSGSYTVQVTNASGCHSAVSSATNITVNPLPAAPTVSASGPLAFCQGGNVTLTSSSGTRYLWHNGDITQSIIVSNGGNYSVRVSNANGCQSVSSAGSLVLVNALPPVPTITQSGNTFTSSWALGNQWYFNGAAIAGAANQSYTYSTGGNYSAAVTNTNGCSSKSEIITAMRMSNAGLDNGQQFYHKVSPNPVAEKGTAVLRYQLLATAEVSIYVTDARGQQVLMLQYRRQQVPGIYSFAIGNKLQVLGKGLHYVVYHINNNRVVETIFIQ
jgi:hypothetical protein